MNHLEEVRLDSICNCVTGNGIIARMASRNPKLRIISFHRIDLTNAALTSLAELQHLTDLSIHNNRTMTTAGILTLLRGASRNVIRKLFISKQYVDGVQVSSEISLMCEERGTTFDKWDGGAFFEYEIRV